MDYPERERQFNAAEAPQHRIHVVGMAEALLANMPAVQRGLAEMSMQTPQIEQEPQDTVTHVDFQNHHIVEAALNTDLAQAARDQINSIAV